jgi:hypothetical protein
MVKLKYKNKFETTCRVFRTVHDIAKKHNSMIFLMSQKGKVPVHAMEACRGSRGIAPLILNLGTRWR